MFSLQTGVVPGRFSATQRFSKIRSSPEKSNSEVGTLLKSQIRPAWAAEWEMGDSPTLGVGGWTAIQVPLLSAALIQLISVSCSALQAFGFVT